MGSDQAKLLQPAENTGLFFTQAHKFDVRRPFLGQEIRRLARITDGCFGFDGLYGAGQAGALQVAVSNRGVCLPGSTNPRLEVTFGQE